MNGTESHNWKGKFASGNGLVQHVIMWANVDPDLCRHMTSVDRNELINILRLNKIIDDIIGAQCIMRSLKHLNKIGARTLVLNTSCTESVWEIVKRLCAFSIINGKSDNRCSWSYSPDGRRRGYDICMFLSDRWKMCPGIATILVEGDITEIYLLLSLFAYCVYDVAN